MTPLVILASTFLIPGINLEVLSKTVSELFGTTEKPAKSAKLDQDLIRMREAELKMRQDRARALARGAKEARARSLMRNLSATRGPVRAGLLGPMRMRTSF